MIRNHPFSTFIFKDSENIIIGAGEAAFDYAIQLGHNNKVKNMNRSGRVKCLPLLWKRVMNNPRISNFIIKLTPVNPTFKALINNIQTLITSDSKGYEIKDELEAGGFKAILSIGEWEENRIGSNCGQYVQACQNGGDKLTGAYSHKLS